MISIAFLANSSKREEYITEDEQHAGDRDETRLFTVPLLFRKIFGTKQLHLRPAILVSNTPSPARDEYQIYLEGGVWFGTGKVWEAIFLTSLSPIAVNSRTCPVGTF